MFRNITALLLIFGLAQLMTPSGLHAEKRGRKIPKAEPFCEQSRKKQESAQKNTESAGEYQKTASQLFKDLKEQRDQFEKGGLLERIKKTQGKLKLMGRIAQLNLACVELRGVNMSTGKDSHMSWTSDPAESARKTYLEPMIEWIEGANECVQLGKEPMDPCERLGPPKPGENVAARALTDPRTAQGLQKARERIKNLLGEKVGAWDGGESGGSVAEDEKGAESLSMSGKRVIHKDKMKLPGADQSRLGTSPLPSAMTVIKCPEFAEKKEDALKQKIYNLPSIKTDFCQGNPPSLDTAGLPGEIAEINRLKKKWWKIIKLQKKYIENLEQYSRLSKIVKEDLTRAKESQDQANRVAGIGDYCQQGGIDYSEEAAELARQTKKLLDMAKGLK